jgi:tetratricopeptide (TPR) repeat protein
VYSETLYPRYHFGWSELYAATEARFRYVKAPRPELYDLRTDPGEARNLAGSLATTAAGLDRWLADQLAKGPIAEPAEVPAETRDKLQALGYIGSGTATAAGGDRPDPKDRIGSYEDLRRALQLREQRKDAEAVDGFRKVLAENPAMIDAWEVLGTTLVRMGRYEEGIEALQQTLRLDPARAQTHLALVKAYVLQGKIPLAMEEAERAAAGDPANAYQMLAQLMLDLGRLDQAASFARKSLADDDQQAMSHFVLGLVAQRGGRYREALDRFRRAEEILSRVKTATIRTLHANIGDCLARLGREAEAEREFRAEIEEMPASREGRVGLSMLYRSQGRDAEAREVLAGLVAAEPQPTADTYWTVVRTFTVLGDAPAAREWAARARARFPSDPRFR